MNEKTEWRVTSLEETQKTIKDDLKEILENHLPHIDSAIESLKTRVNVSTAFNVGAIITGIILSFAINKFFL